MKRVFPDQEPRELGPDHEIFHLVYNLGIPQVPASGHGNGPHLRVLAWRPEGDEAPHFWGFLTTRSADGTLMPQQRYWRRLGTRRRIPGVFPGVFRSRFVPARNQHRHLCDDTLISVTIPGSTRAA